MIKYSDLADGAVVAVSLYRATEDTFVAKEELPGFLAAHRRRMGMVCIDGRRRPAVWMTEALTLGFDRDSIYDILADYEDMHGYDGFADDCLARISDADKDTVCGIFARAFAATPVYHSTSEMVDVDEVWEAPNA